MQTDEKQINIYECIPASLIEAHKGIICKIISFENLAGNNNINFEIMPSGGFTFRKESGYTTHQSIGKDLITKKEVDEAIRKLLKSFNETIYKLKDYDKRVPSQFFPLNYLKNISIELIDKKDKSPVYWSCLYKFEVPAYEISVKNDKKEERHETIKCIINNADLQIDVNKKGMIIGMQYNLLPFEKRRKLPMYNILTPDNKLPQVNYLINSQTCSIAPFFISAGETAYLPACKESILPKDIEKPKSNTDALGVYYMLEPDCIRVGQVGKNTDVRLINKGVDYEYAKKNIDSANNALDTVDLKSEEGKMVLDVINSFSKRNSTSVGMKEDELMMRAFLTLISHCEKHSTNSPESYNTRNKTNQDGTYPNSKNIKKPFGFYQLSPYTFQALMGANALTNPANQDATTVKIIKTFKDGKAFELIINGDLANPLKRENTLREISTILGTPTANCPKGKDNSQWPSLPEQSQQKDIDIKEGLEIFQKAVIKELKGSTDIKTKKGDLLK